MNSYMYKTTAPAVVAAVIAWDAKRAAWNTKRGKLGQVFGGETSPMRSGSRSYVGGVKLSASRDLDVHWCRPDQYGYRALRSSAKSAKGTSKEERAAQVAEHERLSALWKEHCPASIDQDEAWEAMGLNPGALWLGGGVFFELDGAVFLSLGIRLDGVEQIEGAAEILGSKFEAAREQVLGRRKTA
ncbi:hypothetical protein IZT72_07670 [Pseudomonas brenneri]|uniref:hypothetical protein n=1 Tax=Pseudomonas brenneri TaxID=129817 RepID=UPI0018A2C1A1|nr:hypothetical protein [Pseudomonas brenneri]MBF8004475.1 hypothetical protein [Pseudomonas brenneri]